MLVVESALLAAKHKLVVEIARSTPAFGAFAAFGLLGEWLNGILILVID